MHGHHERLEPEQTESTRATSEYASSEYRFVPNSAWGGWKLIINGGSLPSATWTIRGIIQLPSDR